MSTTNFFFLKREVSHARNFCRVKVSCFCRLRERPFKGVCKSLFLLIFFGLGWNSIPEIFCNTVSRKYALCWIICIELIYCIVVLAVLISLTQRYLSCYHITVKFNFSFSQKLWREKKKIIETPNSNFTINWCIENSPPCL